MKNLSFVMDSNFNLHLTNKNEVYEFENLATNLVIETVVDSAMEYELHFKHNDDKYIKLLTKNEGSLSCELTSNILQSDGYYTIQIRGIKGDTRIISNAYRFMVNSFINTAYEPTPEEESIVTQILTRISEIESDVNDLVDLVDEKQDTLVSGVNIRTINGESILGSGNMVIQGGSGADVTMEDNPDGGVDLTVDEITRTLAEQSDLDDLDEQLAEVESQLGDKVDKVTNVTTGNEMIIEAKNANSTIDLQIMPIGIGLINKVNNDLNVITIQAGMLGVASNNDTTGAQKGIILTPDSMMVAEGNAETIPTVIPISDLKQIPNIKNKANTIDLTNKLNKENVGSESLKFFSTDRTVYSVLDKNNVMFSETDDDIIHMSEVSANNVGAISAESNTGEEQHIIIESDKIKVADFEDSSDTVITLDNLKNINDIDNKVNVDNYGADPYVYFEYDGREEDYDDLYKTSLSAYGLYMNGEEMNGTKHVCSFDTREIAVQVGDYTTPDVQSYIRIGGTQIRLLDTGETRVTDVPISDLKQILNIKNKQNTLVSGTNIRTINGQSILGSGNLVISGGSITVSELIQLAQSMTDSEKAQFRSAIGVNFTNAEDEGGF